MGEQMQQNFFTCHVARCSVCKCELNALGGGICVHRPGIGNKPVVTIHSLLSELLQFRNIVTHGRRKTMRFTARVSAKNFINDMDMMEPVRACTSNLRQGKAQEKVTGRKKQFPDIS
jgi:hypothetical protein